MLSALPINLAWGLSGRVTRVGVSNGHAPLRFDGDVDKMSSERALLYRLGYRAPWIIGPAMRMFVRKVGKDPRAFVVDAVKSYPPSEAAMWDTEFTDLVVDAATRQAQVRGAGMVSDIRAELRPWGFSPADIPMPVALWYGEDDGANPAHGRRLAEMIPNCDAHFFPDEAHEVFHTHFPEVLAAALN
jgi:hypothetical protein